MSLMKKFTNKSLKVNSWTQWGKLKAIMVGDAGLACYQPQYQPSHIPKVNDYSSSRVAAAAAAGEWPIGSKEMDRINAANEDLEKLSNLLRDDYEIEVIRPALIDHRLPIKTPYFNTDSQYCAVCPRDSIITVGNIILEASMSRRDRYFEIYSYREIIEDLWKNDKNSLWKAAPKSTMNDDMYSHEWNALSDNDKMCEIIDNENVSFILKDDREVVFDAADLTKTGKHIFGQISCTTNMNAIRWLQRELYNFNVYVHPIRFINDTTPSHIDCTFVILKEGLVMTNPDRPLREEYKEIWEENGWQLLDAPSPNRLDKPMYSQSSEWLNMNILIVDEDTVIVEKEETNMQEFLHKKCGFNNVIPLSFRNVYEFGGSLNCSTWDITREDSCYDLFPKFDVTEYEEKVFGGSRSKQGYHNLRKESLVGDWSNINEEYGTQDEDGKLSFLKIDGHPVMEQWELPYMQEFAKIVCNNSNNTNNTESKKILEIGYGLGLSANAIYDELSSSSSSKVGNEHHIIELNSNVFERLVNDYEQVKSNDNVLIVPVHGNSYTKLNEYTNNYFDGIFYDTYPMSKDDQHSHQFRFLKDARSKVKKGGRVVYCNLTSFGVLKRDDLSWEQVFEDTQIPYLTKECGWHRDEIEFVIYTLPKSAIKQREEQQCEYYSHDTCIIPILTRKHDDI